MKQMERKLYGFRFCTPSKDENLRKKFSIITSALAFSVSLYECRHILTSFFDRLSPQIFPKIWGLDLYMKL